MFQYHCLNPIAERGLNLFSEDYSEEMGEMPEQAAEEPAGEE